MAVRPLIPNATTVAAMIEARTENLLRANSIEALWNTLYHDD